MKHVKPFLLCCLFLLVSCSGQDTERLRTLENININITARDLPFNDRYYARVIEFSGVSGNDTSKVRIVATIYRDSACAITISPFEYVIERNIKDLEKTPNMSNGYVLSYDEQIAMLLKVTDICKNKYGVKDFVHICACYDGMGDLAVQMSEKYDSLLETVNDANIYNTLHVVLEESDLSEDLQLLFSDYQVVYDSESLFLFPEKISYTKFASYNKLKKQYTRDYVYSGVFAEYRINKKE